MPAGPENVPRRSRRNLWLGVAIGAVALLFYFSIIVKIGTVGL